MSGDPAHRISAGNQIRLSREAPNLYVAGPGILPTCSASNPTYTVLHRVRAVAARGGKPRHALELDRGVNDPPDRHVHLSHDERAAGQTREKMTASAWE